MKGKSGRGKSVFMKYLIFYILFEAKRRREEATSSAKLIDNEQHLFAPKIIYVDRERQNKYLITLDSIAHIDQNLNGDEHYYFSDNVDIKESFCSFPCVTLALTSGGSTVLKECYKRISEVGGKEAFMQSLSLEEMKLLFVGQKFHFSGRNLFQI
jgi:hypothetical protein